MSLRGALMPRIALLSLFFRGANGLLLLRFRFARVIARTINYVSVMVTTVRILYKRPILVYKIWVMSAWLAGVNFILSMHD